MLISAPKNGAEINFFSIYNKKNSKNKPQRRLLVMFSFLSSLSSFYLVGPWGWSDPVIPPL